jgi:hypothetical protein
MLHTYSLAEPDTAARVRNEFPVLDTPDGVLAEAIVLTEILQGITRGDNLILTDAINHRAQAVRTHLAAQPA